MEQNIKARIIDAQIEYFNAYEASIKLKPFNGKDVLLTVNDYYSTRSLNQNAYYWGVVIPEVKAFLEETEGMKADKNVIHQFHLSKIAGIKLQTIEFMGEPMVIFKGKKSSEMTKIEFGNFIEKIQYFWAEKGCNIPDPETKTF